MNWIGYNRKKEKTHKWWALLSVANVNLIFKLEHVMRGVLVFNASVVNKAIQITLTNKNLKSSSILKAF